MYDVRASRTHVHRLEAGVVNTPDDGQPKLLLPMAVELHSQRLVPYELPPPSHCSLARFLHLSAGFPDIIGTGVEKEVVFVQAVIQLIWRRRRRYTS